MTQRITQSPDPASPGDEVTFCYDIAGVALPIKLKGKWSPNGPEFEWEIVGKVNCITVTVPEGKDGGTIEDGSGQSDTYAIAVDT